MPDMNKLEQQLNNAKNVDEAMEILTAEGLSFNADELMDLVVGETAEDGEISLDALDNVAGGCLNCFFTYISCRLNGMSHNDAKSYSKKANHDYTRIK